jgi:transposase
VTPVRSSRRPEADPPQYRGDLAAAAPDPDFKTIADFRQDNGNVFHQVFCEFVLVCGQLDLFGRKMLALGETRIKAVNQQSNFTRASLIEFIKVANAKLDDYLQRLGKSDAAECRKDGSRVKTGFAGCSCISLLMGQTWSYRGPSFIKSIC